MNNENLKKKIIEIMSNVWSLPVPCTAERKFEHIADALIAAGIGDVETVQNISASATAMAVLEAAQAEHRAARAERALKKLASFFAHNVKFLKDEREKERYQKTIFDDWINQAEEELAEERKDD